MWVVHLINKIDPRNGRLAGLNPASEIDPNGHHFHSCCWDFSLEEAQKLIGGMIYLHLTKKRPAEWAGRVKDVGPINLRDKTMERFFPHVESMGLDPKKFDRVKFIVEILPERRGEKWRGADHSMSWTSGIIEVDTDY